MPLCPHTVNETNNNNITIIILIINALFILQKNHLNLNIKTASLNLYAVDKIFQISVNYERKNTFIILQLKGKIWLKQ